MQLSRIGWRASHEAFLRATDDPSLAPARVAREDRGRYLLLGEFGETIAELRGRLRRDSPVLPAVGDWVTVRHRPAEGRATIHGILPRASEFRRMSAGRTSRAQVLAANVDVVFVVTGLDQNYSLRRIERYLTLAGSTGAEPVVVLNKADLEDDVDLRIRQVRGVAGSAEILATSGRSGAGIDAVRARLGPGRTGVFLGSSGVGKSTIVNRLLGEDALPTHEVRAADDRGRHTTTRRELILLPGDDGVVIDTPGLREIQLLGDADDLGASFGDVMDLADGCRFRDCRHQGEPGCAVQAALGAGTLDPDRFESYLEQRRELAYQERRVDERARKAEEGRWRRIAIEQRRIKKHRHGRR